MAIYEIPLIVGPQTLSVAIPNGTANMRLIYVNAPSGEGGWVLDIRNSNNDPVVCGIPLVTGADLLAQYAYLNIGVVMFVLVDGMTDAVPGFADIGATAHLYVEY